MKTDGQGENPDHAVFQTLRKDEESVCTLLNMNKYSWERHLINMPAIGKVAVIFRNQNKSNVRHTFLAKQASPCDH